MSLPFQLLFLLREHVDDGDAFGLPGFIEPQRFLQRRKGHFIHTQRPVEGVLFEYVHILLFAEDDARLRAAQKLVAGEADNVHPGTETLLHRGFALNAVFPEIHQTAAAQILDHGQTVAVAQLHQLGERRGLAEADDAVVAGVYLHNGLRLFADGPLVVVEMGLVGGAHLPEPCPAAFHDVGHPEGPADLYQLATGYGHLAPGSERREDQEHGGGVVVHHQCALRPGETAEERLHVAVAAAPAAAFQIIFQRAVVPGGIPGGCDGPGSKGGTAQIGVEDNARSVDHPPQ